MGSGRVIWGIKCPICRQNENRMPENYANTPIYARRRPLQTFKPRPDAQPFASLRMLPYYKASGSSR